MAEPTPTDRAMMAVLRANGRASISELAQTLGISRTTARMRLDRLIADGRIRRFTIETDTDAEGEVHAISLVQLQGKMSRSVIRALTRIPEISTVYSTNGNWDLVAEIRADSLVSFDNTLRAIREVPGVLNSESCILLTHVSG